MRISALDDGVIGLQLGRALCDRAGRPLLRAGVTLTPVYIAELRRRGFSSIPVFDPLAPDAVPVEAVREETRARAAVVVEEVLSRAQADGRLEVARARSVVDHILDEVSGNADLAFSLTSLRSLQGDVFAHSVDVCIYSVVLGRALALDRHDMHRLGLGAILHDVGLILFQDLVSRGEDLTAEEAEVLQAHTTEGYNLLHQQPGIPLLSAHVAFQHHERIDGSGYPRGLRGQEIHVWARLVAVADVYDKLTAGLAGGSPLRPDLAMAELRNMADTGKLDERFVRHLMQRIAAYPEGTILLLESGEVAVTTGQGLHGGQSPAIRVVTDAALMLREPEERMVDGSGPGTTVRSVLSDYPERVREQLRERERADPGGIGDTGAPRGRRPRPGPRR